MTGIVRLGLTFGELINKGLDAFAREQDRAAGRNEANLEARVKQDEVKKDADKVWDSRDVGRFRRMRNDSVPPKD